MIASIYIIFPQEHPELRDNAIQHFHWTMERYVTMKHRNAMAYQAQNVLAAIQARFVYAMGAAPSPAGSSTREPSLISGMSHTTPESSRSVSTPSAATGSGAAGALSRGSYMPDAAPTPGQQYQQQQQQWDTWASNADLAAMAPTYPTTDLLFNDLMVMKDAQFPEAPQDNLQFGGDFEENTFWQFLNSLPSGAAAGESAAYLT